MGRKALRSMAGAALLAFRLSEGLASLRHLFELNRLLNDDFV